MKTWPERPEDWTHENIPVAVHGPDPGDMTAGIGWTQYGRQQEVLRNFDNAWLGQVLRDWFTARRVWVAYEEPAGEVIGKYRTRQAAKTAVERHTVRRFAYSVHAKVLNNAGITEGRIPSVYDPVNP